MNRPLGIIHANMRAHRDTPLQFVSIRVPIRVNSRIF